MLYLGLFVSIFIFSSLFLLLILYFVSVFKNKFDLANILFPYTFLHSMFTLLILYWSLIIMNRSFNIVYSLNINYNYTLFFIIPIMLLIGVCDFFVRKNLACKSKVIRFFRFLLPLAVIILYTLCAILFFFNCNYFYFLK